MATRGSVNMSKAEVRWNGEIFHRLGEAQAETERWPIHYNTKRPQLSLGDGPPAPRRH